MADELALPNLGAINALRFGQQQIDATGEMVGVSRQALDELLDWFDKATAPAILAALQPEAPAEATEGLSLKDLLELIHAYLIREKLRQLDFVRDGSGGYEATTRPWDAPAAQREAGEVEGRDAGATFVLERLGQALGVDDWTICDGTEEWEGDVAATLWSILCKARVIDDEDNSVARHPDPSALTAQATELAALKAVVAEAREHIDRSTSHLDSWARDHSMEATTETWAILHCNRAFLARTTDKGGSDDV